MSKPIACPLFGCLLAFGAAGAAQAPPVVTVAQPLERETADYDFKGRLAPCETVEVRAQVGGVVERAHARPGVEVKKGELLVELDAGPLKKELEAAETEVKRQEGRLREREQALEQARKAPKPPGKADLEKLAAERDLAAALVQVARANAERLRADLELTRVRAPIGGRVVGACVAAGDRVQAGVGFATCLCTLARTDPVRVAFDVDERTLLDLLRQVRAGKDRAGDPGKTLVLLGLDTEKGHPHRGTLELIENRVDPKSGRVRAYAHFPNADGSLTRDCLVPEKERRPARVRLTVGRTRKVLLVPEQAVLGEPGGESQVLVVNDKEVVESRRVRRGALHDGLQAVEEGLKPDEWVVVATGRQKRDPADKTLSPEDFARDLRLLRVKPGTTVVPVRVALPAPDPGKQPKP